VKENIVAVMSEARQVYPDATIEEDIGYEFETYTISAEEAVAVRVIAALSSIGLDPFLGPSGGGTDGNVFRAHGVQAVVVGMGTNAAHTVREYVEISQLTDVARFCQALLIR
jgi:tripeptide aminopeptidase